MACRPGRRAGIEANEFRLIDALISAGRLSEGESERRALVEKAMQRLAVEDPRHLPAPTTFASTASPRSTSRSSSSASRGACSTLPMPLFLVVLDTCCTRAARGKRPGHDFFSSFDGRVDLASYQFYPRVRRSPSLVWPFWAALGFAGCGPSPGSFLWVVDEPKQLREARVCRIFGVWMMLLQIADERTLMRSCFGAALGERSGSRCPLSPADLDAIPPVRRRSPAGRGRPGQCGWSRRVKCKR